MSITNATEYGLVYTPDETAALGRLARERGLGFHVDGARFANAVARLGCAPADLTWRAGVDALSFGFVKNGGLSAEALVFFRPELAAATLYRRKRAGHLLSKGRYLAAQILAMLEDDLWLRNARAANRSAARLAEAAGGRLVLPVEANEVFLKVSPQEAKKLRDQGFDFLRLGPRRGPFGDQLGQRARPDRGARRGDRIAVNQQEGALPAGARPDPVHDHHPDLGLDLDRHQGPARRGAAALVGHLPLHHRLRGDVPLRRRDPRSAPDRAPRATGWRLPSGFPQFVLNFNFVYAAEQHITSGVVAVVFALLLVPNSAFARIFLGHRLSGGFLLGSAIAMAGVALLFVHEMRASTASAGAVAIGIGLTMLGVLSASVANVMQATERMRAFPIVSMLAWGMLYGTIANGLFAFVLHGPPVVESRIGYWLGLIYLGLFASALAFTFYFGVLRADRARPRRLFEPDRADDRDDLLDPVRGLSLVGARRRRRPARSGGPVHRAAGAAAGLRPTSVCVSARWSAFHCIAIRTRVRPDG